MNFRGIALLLVNGGNLTIIPFNSCLYEEIKVYKLFS
jgi:hypothetical protein